MLNMLKKEFSLAMHPTVLIMMAMSFMVLIPNYPYSVMFFYISMGLIFTCLGGRENNDIVFSLNLPISKSDIVKSRITFSVIVEMIQLIILIPFAILSQIINTTGNYAGMDANIAFFAEGFIIYGIFNLIFFTGYYKNVSKVGFAFIKSGIAMFVCVIIEIICTYAVPFVRDCLDTDDPQFIIPKLIFLAIGIVIFVGLTLISTKISIHRFEKQDIN